MTDHDLATLLEQLLSDDAILTQQAAQRIAEKDPPAQAAALPLIQAIASPHLDTMEWAVSALEDLGAPNNRDLDQLIEMLEAYCTGRVLAEQAFWAITLIGRLQETSPRTLDSLLRVLEFTDELAVKEKIIWAIGRIGPAAIKAITVVETFAASDQPRLARLADEALNRLRA